MKKKSVVLLCAMLALGAGSVCTAAENETEAAEIAATVTLTIEDADPVEVKNTAQIDMKAVSVETAEEEGKINITMVSADGVEYEFVNVDYADMQEPELVEDGAFAYLVYTGIASGKERRVGQTGELIYPEAAELYATDDVYIRAEADSEAEILGVIHRGDAIEVLGETASHYKVQKEDVTGYTVRSCISEDEQEAIAAVAQEEAARELIRQQEAAAATAAQAAAQASSGGGKTEVKRQKFDDCDGSGHGYYEITYSDGSVSYQDY